ncbi:uncharacterized protein LOC125241110 isoform X1 [Leguminivora glycinivorella]|uniref:uncharacterized protein LOC125241110 isoform X1 n=1 Tax=Leguminivora glycinivorella TaxID=1035111 RepID=UPI00200D52B7|nr:uncharacterized protein LOC125241110 isoform X1 [Leguminivora glycinivorella]
MRGPAVLFVGFIFFASGLTKPVKKIRVRHVQQHDVSPETNSSSINGMMNASNEKDKIFDVSNVKALDVLGDRLLNKVKERSLVKIIKKSKRPRYKLRDSILENDIFSVAGPETNNNTVVTFNEIFSAAKAGLKLVTKNLTIAENMSTNNMEKKNEFINTYLPLKTLTNGSEVEIIKNTILRSKSQGGHKPPNNAISDKSDQASSRRNLKHQVRKYFRLHSSVPNELEAQSVVSKPKLDIIWSPENGATVEPVLKTDNGPSGTTLAPRIQSIVLRWNLILV